MPRPTLPALILVCLLVVLAGCASSPGVRELPENARAAEALFAEGDFRSAAEAFLDAADGSRSNRDFFRLRAAEAWREEGELAAAGRALDGVNPRALDEDERLRLALLQAELALATDAPGLALERLAQPAARLPARHRARFFELRGQALEALQDPFAAAVEYAQLDAQLSGAERSENAARIRGLLSGLGDRPLQQGSATLPGGHPLQPYAARALTARGLALPERFRAQPSAAIAQPAPASARQIALLLPQDGPLRLAASSLRDGFMAAHFAASEPRPQIRLYDSGQTPEEAVAAYRLAVAEGAERVIGPLSRDAVSAVFGEPDLPVPLVALNRSVNPLPPGHLSFALAPDEEAAAVASRLQQRGLRRVVAVIGADDSAQRALAGFTARHLQAGGELLGTVAIPDEGVDYMAAIRQTLTHAGLPTSRPKELSIPHDPGFDAVFLALRPGQARLAVPQLRIFGITELPIFATSSINAVEDGNRLDRDLNGIEFSEVPWLVGDLPGLPRRSELAAKFDSARGPAARLFAFGWDAYQLQALGVQYDGSERQFDGATGQIRIDPFGEARREPGFAVFRNQRARLIEAGALIDDGESAR